MRKILFRGKHKSEWIYGDYVSPSSIEDGIGDIYCVAPETIGQYVDLIDANGTKIFEGDIMLDSLHRLLQVVFKHGKFVCKALTETNFAYCDVWEWFWYRRFSKAIVIGNIYDNSELVISKQEIPTGQY